MRRWAWGVWFTVAGWLLVVVVAHHPQRARGRGVPWSTAGVWGAVAVAAGWAAVGTWVLWRRRRIR
ncbi:hypothetical protein [Streptomyces sp. NPDC049040]|uniref:hypothetical protein n=1 Tax=Streptomyces sp. NPDC049040 TaxID=3365593 RepID=UPI0037214A06